MRTVREEADTQFSRVNSFLNHTIVPGVPSVDLDRAQVDGDLSYNTQRQA